MNGETRRSIPDGKRSSHIRPPNFCRRHTGLANSNIVCIVVFRCRSASLETRFSGLVSAFASKTSLTTLCPPAWDRHIFHGVSFPPVSRQCIVHQPFKAKTRRLDDLSLRLFCLAFHFPLALAQFSQKRKFPQKRTQGICVGIVETTIHHNLFCHGVSFPPVSRQCIVHQPFKAKT